VNAARCTFAGNKFIMKFNREQLINDLLTLTEASSKKVMEFRQLDNQELNFKPGPEKWSILECIEHLNLYGDFYLPEIERRILSQKTSDNHTVFKSGLIGNYFAKLMQVKDGKISKMKSPKDKNPANSALTKTTLDRFLKQQERLRGLLNQSRKIDLTRTKASISLTPLIKLRLGDTFRFFIYHIERHVLQAEKVMTSFEKQIHQKA
jgi:hypothetical protein